MKQMITRLDDELHARVKDTAAAQGRSVNDFVTEILDAAVNQLTPRELIRARARAKGLLVIPEQPKKVPSRRSVIAATRGSGNAASEALAAERSHR